MEIFHFGSFFLSFFAKEMVKASKELNSIMFINVIGTVVKSKRGKMLADLAQPWDEVLVARGGQEEVLYIHH